MQEGGLNPGRWEERLENDSLTPTPNQPYMAVKVRLEDAGLVPTRSQPDLAVKVLSETQHKLISF